MGVVGSNPVTPTILSTTQDQPKPLKPKNNQGLTDLPPTLPLFSDGYVVSLKWHVNGTCGAQDGYILRKYSENFLQIIDAKGYPVLSIELSINPQDAKGAQR